MWNWWISYVMQMIMLDWTIFWGKVCVDVFSLQTSRESHWQQEGELFTFSNIYFCIRYQVHKCKYSESIIKSIRNYRECNTNCNKFNKLELSSYHTLNQPVNPLRQKYWVLFSFFWSYTKLITISTDYCLFYLCWKTLKHQSTILYS